MEKFATLFTRGPGIALMLAAGSVLVVIGFMSYHSRNFRKALRQLGPDPNKTVRLPLIKVTEVSHDTKIFRCALEFIIKYIFSLNDFRFALDEGHRLGLPVGQHVNTKAKIDGKLVMIYYYKNYFDPATDQF